MSDNKTILIIEDEPLIADMITQVLAKHGIRCAWNGSASDALAALKAGTVAPALIMLDGILPDMDGWDFMKALGADESIAPIPIIVMSSLVDFEASQIPKRVKIVGKLDKPFTPGLLVETVKQALADTVGG